MIQPIGKSPDRTPNAVARSAMLMGIVNTATAITIATTSAITAARCALILPDAIITSRSTIGIIAAIVEAMALCSGS